GHGSCRSSLRRGLCGHGRKSGGVCGEELSAQARRERRERGRISIFEKLRAQATSSKFQTPSSKEAPSSKLKNRPARRLPRHLFLGFGALSFGTSLELWVWCLVFRSALAQTLRYARHSRDPGFPSPGHSW